MSTDAIQAWLDQHQAQLIDETRRMLQVPSLKAAPVASGAAKPAPFGQPVRDALDLALQLGHEAGMRTKDIEGYAGYAEFGSGDRLVVILGHLDVVPVGKGWNHAPFGAEIDGEYIYSRGAVDDKGPTMAAFHAARAVQACVPDLPARVRIVFGCDEESGMECVQRYLKTEEVPTFGFAPDAGWPVIHGEKGIVNYTVRVEVPASPFRLLELTGGQAANIVIDACRARVQVDASVRAEVEKAIADGWDRNVTATWAGDELQLEAIGKAAHGSEPWYGDSAATRLLRRLFEIAPLPAKKLHKELLKLAHVSGVGLGIHGRDEASGDLTCNLGLCSTRTDGDAIHVEMLFNIRYPVTWKGAELQARLEAHLATLACAPFSLVEVDDSAPLWFPIDHPLVETITRVYREETGDMTPPQTMGGGTYARMVPNTVAIGTGWEGDGGAHQTDERVKIASLHRMAGIYAKVIHALATVTV